MITIVIVSDETAEGKTTLAKQLAYFLKNEGVDVSLYNKINVRAECEEIIITRKDDKIAEELDTTCLEVEIIDITGGVAQSVRSKLGI